MIILALCILGSTAHCVHSHIFRSTFHIHIINVRNADRVLIRVHYPTLSYVIFVVIITFQLRVRRF